MKRTGRCMCGAISIDVAGELRDVFNCHCHRCPRFTGAGHTYGSVVLWGFERPGPQHA